MPPVRVRPCSIDLWQFLSISTASPEDTVAPRTIRFDVDVPFVTQYVRSAPNTFAAWRSLAPIGPEWSRRDPSSATEIDRSERNMGSPKNWKKARPTGDFRKAVPPAWPGVCQEYS